MNHTRRVQLPVVSGYITIVTDQYQLPAFWAHPQLTKAFPGLVLIHEETGLTPHTRMCVRRLAEMGFYVIAPDLFDGQPPTSADARAEVVAALGEAGVARVSSALSVLRTHNHCNGKVGVVGWQLGGEIALQMTILRQDLRAVVIFYARPDDYMPMLPAEEAPLLAFYGDADPAIPPSMLERMREMLAASPGHGEVVIYPNASTGFFNNAAPTYHEEYATDAWSKMVEFLAAHLEVPRHQQRPQVY
jgi:carboxymethylenebutenolidase